MFYDYLNDIEFLKQLDSSPLRTTYAKLVLLSFDETPLKEIQGQITTGTMQVNGSSAVRRTINLTMLASFENSGIENLDNEISINKKVQVFIGLKNTIKGYEEYGEIVWFPLGVYILSSANVTRNTNGWNIQIAGKDKMCRLDGTCGGTLPATTIFHTREIQQDDGTYITENPTIYQIIFEAVNHWGGEIAENIVISDVDEEVKLLVKYMGDIPIHFSDEYTSMRISASTPTGFPNTYTYGQDVGYEMTPFTYPGELVLKAGDTVVTLLNKIRDTLGNYEFFYDVWGHFIFQEVKNYLNKASPLTELVESDYTRSYNNAKYLYDLTKLDTTTAITKSPKYDNIKNDFYVWGERETPEGAKLDIRYHLVIDKKPLIDLATKYMWAVYKDGVLTRYEFTTERAPQTTGAQLISTPCDEWREELYRLALVAQITNSVYDNYYDSELIAEWRKLYDPMNIDYDATNHWNPAVYTDPDTLDYWLDFIDSGDAAIGGYSVNQIGRRTKVLNDSDVRVIYNKDVPDIVFIEGRNNELIEQYRNIGQKVFVLMPEYYSLFMMSSTGASCYDRIREMMYQNLSYNTTITLTCLPKYYIEPNNIIHIEDADMGIDGNYQITQFSLPLTYNGTMNITATEVLSRV